MNKSTFSIIFQTLNLAIALVGFSFFFFAVDVISVCNLNQIWISSYFKSIDSAIEISPLICNIFTLIFLVSFISSFSCLVADGRKLFKGQSSYTRGKLKIITYCLSPVVFGFGFIYTVLPWFGYNFVQYRGLGCVV